MDDGRIDMVLAGLDAIIAADPDGAGIRAKSELDGLSWPEFLARRRAERASRQGAQHDLAAEISALFIQAKATLVRSFDIAGDELEPPRFDP